jgi:hypothetical protein
LKVLLKIYWKSISQVGWSEDISKGWKAKLEEVVSTKTEVFINSTYEIPSGIKLLFTKLVPEFGKEGNVKSIMAITRDVTDSGITGS